MDKHSNDNDDRPLKEFIPDKLDEARLTTSEFRVYCHISRRKVCFSKLSQIQYWCRVNEHTARKAIKSLMKRNMISSKIRPGKTTEYRTKSLSEWDRPVIDRATTPLARRATGSRYKKSNAKCIPREVYPRKVNPSCVRQSPTTVNHSFKDYSRLFTEKVKLSITENTDCDLEDVEKLIKQQSNCGWVNKGHRVNDPIAFIERGCLHIASCRVS